LSNNVVKWNCINLDNNRVIDSDKREDIGVMAVLREAAAKKQKELMMNSADTPESAPQFEEGIGYVNYDNVLKEEREKMLSEIDSIREEAQKEADELILQAREQVQSIKEKAYEDGKAEGLEAGLEESKKHFDEMQEAFEQEKQGFLDDYKKQVEQAEPIFAELIASLVEKITGVVVEDRKDVITHLVTTAMKQIKRSNKLVIRVSSEDYYTLEKEKDNLASILEGGTDLIIVEDESFEKNQCIIEADSQMIDCSLDVQLQNLKNDLKILALRR